MDFEESVLKVLRLLGYTVHRNVTIAGCQIDMLAEYRTGAIILRLMVECKDYGEGQAVGVKDIKELSGVLHPIRGKAIDKALLVSRHGFTRAAKELADIAGIHLVEFAELANQLLDFDGYIERVIKEFDESTVAKYYIDLSYALTEDYVGGDTDLIQRPLDDAVNQILFHATNKSDPLIVDPERLPTLHPHALNSKQTLVALQDDDSSGPHVPLGESKPNQTDCKIDPILHKGRIALLGNFGTGKTTWCRKYARELALQYRADHTCRIPIVVSLGDYETKLDIQQLITNTLQFRYGVRIDLSICQELQRLGRFIFLFDGFDEMSTRVDAEVVRENLREINKVARIQENVFVLTCRTHFFRDRVQAEVLANFETLFIPEWGEAELAEYLEKRFGKEWQNHLNRIQGTHNLAELAQTPLFLEMITETLPKLGEQVRRSELYQTYTETWITEQSQRRGARLQRQDRKQFVLELATRLYKDNRLSCHYTEFHEMLQTRFKMQDAGQIDYLQSDVRSCTFLTRNSNGDYEFKHKSFMEYFVATAIRDELLQSSDKLMRLKPLPLEVKGFLIEMVPNQTQHELLLSWHQAEQDNILRDNVFALMVGLRLTVPAELKPPLGAQMSEEETILLFLQGDMEIFTQLVNRYSKELQTYIVHFVKDIETAQEIANDAFFTILERRDRINSPKGFRAYLFHTARNRAFDIYRRSKRTENNISLDENKNIAINIVDSSIYTAAEIVMQKDEKTTIAIAMKQLEKVEADVVQQLLFDGKGLSEVAQINNMNLRQIYRVRKRAIDKLRKIVGK